MISQILLVGLGGGLDGSYIILNVFYAIDPEWVAGL